MNDPVRVALIALINKLDLIHASPDYRAVWTLYHAHSRRYNGPDYAEELRVAREALNPMAQGVGPVPPGQEP